MNILIVSEGLVGERYVYENWVPYVNPALSYVPSLYDINQNNFTIVTGGGYPGYFDIIEDAIEDINSTGNIDRLVLAVDSEDMDYQEKYDEMHNFIQQQRCLSSVFIVVQHFCLETWALGNRRLGPKNPKSSELREYKSIHNVLQKDPELLPPHPHRRLNRAQFAEVYLRAMLHDKQTNHKQKNLTYTKSNPKALLHPSYFQQVKSRLDETGHIRSFHSFIKAFTP